MRIASWIEIIDFMFVNFKMLFVYEHFDQESFI